MKIWGSRRLLRPERSSTAWRCAFSNPTTCMHTHTHTHTRTHTHIHTHTHTHTQPLIIDVQLLNNDNTANNQSLMESEEKPQETNLGVLDSSEDGKEVNYPSSSAELNNKHITEEDEALLYFASDVERDLALTNNK